MVLRWFSLFKKLAWGFLKSIASANFERDYEEARRLEVKSALKNLLFHSSSNVPYYHDVLRRENLVNNGKVIQEDYKKLRIMIVLRNGIANESEKREIQEKIELAMGKDCLR